MDYNSLYECIDEFGINIRTEIVDKINKGADVNETLLEASEKVWAYYQKNKNNGIFGAPGTVYLGAKKKDYGKGQWTSCGKLILNIDGEHSDLKEYLVTRLSRFLAMCQELELKKTLVALGYKVREATNNEDICLKVDLFLVIDKKEYAVSVFKDTENSWSRALEKLQRSKAPVDNRVFFSFDKYYNNPKDLKTVATWAEKVAQGKYKFKGEK